jgi:hypothetical protein
MKEAVSVKKHPSMTVYAHVGLYAVGPPSDQLLNDELPPTPRACLPGLPYWLYAFQKLIRFGVRIELVSTSICTFKPKNKLH